MNRIRLVKKLISQGLNYHDLQTSAGISRGTLYKFLNGQEISVLSHLKIQVGFEKLLGSESFRSEFETELNQITKIVQGEQGGNLSCR